LEEIDEKLTVKSSLQADNWVTEITE